jgi:hypothetical protein
MEHGLNTDFDEGIRRLAMVDAGAAGMRGIPMDSFGINLEPAFRGNRFSDCADWRGLQRANQKGRVA